MQPTSGIAIDIVLLPPPHIQEEMIALSKRINDTYGEKIRLNTTDRFPHISLLMLCIPEDQLPKFEPIITEAAQNFLPLELSMESLTSKKTSSGIELQRTPEIADLQKHLLESTQELHHLPVTPECFFETPNKSIMTWVENFIPNCTGDGFHPHITVGPVFSEPEQYEQLTTFSCSTLAICHLGTYGTCRKILHEHSI